MSGSVFIWRAWLAAMAAAVFLGQIGSLRADEIIANAGQIGPDSALLKFVRSPGTTKAMYDLGVVWDRERDAACPDGQHHLVVEYIPEILSPVTIKTGADKPSSGSWSTRFRMQRCNRVVYYRTLFNVTPEGGITHTRILPGESLVGLQMIRDMAMQIRILAGSESGVSNCQQFIVLDTYAPQTVAARQPGYQGQTADHRRERWWIKACNKPVALDIDYFPNPSLPGMSFSMTAVKQPGVYNPR
jgi:hypothetical protein